MSLSEKDPPADAFAELGLPRRLALDPDTLETTWRRRSRELHPDSAQGDADGAAAANRACGILRAPGSRLRHWLALHGVAAPAHTGLDADLMSLFADAGLVLHEADALSKKKSTATTALARALLAAPEFAVQKKLQDLMRRIRQESEKLIDRFEAFEAAAAGGDFTEAAAASGRLAFLERWERQCRDRLLALMTGG